MAPRHVAHDLCSWCGRPTLLDLFAGEGGAGRGYLLAGFCVTAVDNSAARLARYPGADCPLARRIVADALDFLYEHGHLYSTRHTSPPCTGYTRGTVALPDRLERYDRLIPATRDLLEAIDGPYVIENVEDAKSELHTPLTLCWTMFHAPGSVLDEDQTPLWMRRHRLFESNVHLVPPDECRHPRGMQCAGAYGGARRDKVEARTIRKGGYVPSARVMGDLLGIDWMSEKGLQLSIPPAYTEWIGEQVIAQLLGNAIRTS